ncbi:MAG: NIPSNAP family protein [Opitutus sp.]
MKILLSCLASLLIASAVSAAPEVSVYELRTYTAEPGHFNDLITRLTAASQLFAKHGMTNVVYWTPTDEKDGLKNKVIYLLGHKSRQDAAASWKAFIDDPEWVALRDKNEANGKVVTKVDSTFVEPTDFSPMAVKSGKTGGVFELRTYTAAEGKLADLDARFRNHTLKLFEKHGMTNGMYFHPMDAEKGAGKTLVYWLQHDSREAATASWKGFQSDPDWIAARTESEKGGKLTTEVKSIFLQPLEFSPLR